ncbi:MAG: hypothetical protein IH596_07125 [Bacteroidales bacterium]|nr:hypothetical protein [Bacteroidales bacterium]
MKKNDTTQLTQPIHHALCRERVALQIRMEKSGFHIERNKPMKYGFIIHFFYHGEEGWLMVYKNRKNRTNFNFSFISSTYVIEEIIRKIAPSEIAEGEWSYTIPDAEKREKIRWWRETNMSKNSKQLSEFSIERASKSMQVRSKAYLKKMPTSLLTKELFKELVVGSVRIGAQMRKHEFFVINSKLIPYGRQIYFRFQDQEGFFRVYMTLTGFITLDFSGVPSTKTINYILTKIRPRDYFTQIGRINVPPIQNREKTYQVILEHEGRTGIKGKIRKVALDRDYTQNLDSIPF